jgi:hypothetical protein
MNASMCKEFTLLAGAMIAIQADGDEKVEDRLTKSYARVVDKIYNNIRVVKDEGRRHAKC